ncbi:Dabb family protein [Methanolobus chelungpuianus]|uniref:Stress responsive protein n=1 Tax=Methanolobus chelungpuianus TaxID=502115 RepID=A0AAE3HBT6_9EURY|nr:Dabb family protein [Methanolobus chelungpuianus]MCQ6963297.1 stress responsive protein [Methanolobus chelungpuianus]
MLKHIVMWKLKETAEGTNKLENALVMKEMLESLPGRIPEIVSLEVGININPTDAAYDVVLYSEFRDEAALYAYQEHPEHVKVADFVAKVREERAVVDYLA